MKEVFRLEHAKIGGGLVREFNLEIYAGEIVLLCGPAGSGILTLLNFMKGRTEMTLGRVLINGEAAAPRRDLSRPWQQIFVNSAGRNQAENLTVAENLQILRRPDTPFRLYRKAASNQAAEGLLRCEEIAVNPRSRVDQLNDLQRQLLNLVQARLIHASLVVIDATKDDLANADAEELYALIRRMREEGMAFLILAFHPRHFRDLADRFLLMEHGRDVYEWRRGRFGDEMPTSDKHLTAHRPEGRAEGIADPWDFELPEGELLRQLQASSPAYWREHLNFHIPRQGLCLEKGTVLVPKESAMLLAKNLSVKENLMLPLNRRAGKGFTDIWSKAAARTVHEDFCALTDTDPGKTAVRDLSLLERKLLSIHRWEVYQPEVLVLHGLYYGLDAEETERLNQYILGMMRRRRFRVIICSGELTPLPVLCASGTVSAHGREPEYVRFDG